MVFVSQNKIRKCKYCDNEPKQNITKTGRKKGYYRTCGNKICLKKNYEDKHVCLKKGRLRNQRNIICDCCNGNFLASHSNNTRFCKECVPDKQWRARAERYLIGKPQWEFLLQKQNGTCALCPRNPEVVDHCHNKKIVRGLLCNYCNIALAKFDNDIKWLKRALSYIGEKNASIS